MNTNPDIYEWIEAYLLGSLSPNERLEFEKRMTEDAVFAQEVAFQRFINEAVLEKSLLDLKRRVGADLSKPALSRWVWFVLIAVGLMVVGAGLVYTYQQHQKKNAIQHQIPHGYRDHKPLVIAHDTAKEDPVVIPVNKPSLKSQLIEKPSETRLMNTEPLPQMSKPEPTEARKLPEEALPAPVSPVMSSTGSCPDIGFQVHSEPTCTGKEEGVLQVVQSSIKGGEGPYGYALDGGEFTSQSLFQQLPSGAHNVAVKDTRGCISEKKVQVPQKNCIDEMDYAFNPERETWKFPLESHESGSVKITNKNGRVVYESRIVNGSPSEWDGRTIYGEQLEINTYIYILQTDEGKLKRGYIVILR